MIKAAIFDLDGLLINSEPLWESAETNVFARYNIEVTPEICQKVKGFRVDESVVHILKMFKNNDLNPDLIERQIMDEVKELILTHGKALPGSSYILHFFESRKIPIALASSSKMEIIEAALERLGLRNNFSSIHSAEFETYGKPHPSIFLSAAESLGVHPSDCVVFEDSLNGLIAARAARMKVVAVPEKEFLQDKRFSIAHYILPNLLAFKEAHLDILNKSDI
ncbi:MAG: hexitol phosphatase HxpB [Bacteroidales bacterium]|nr:hexitol phosphatase HxpB [Bacteroidales bacterium]